MAIISTSAKFAFAAETISSRIALLIFASVDSPSAMPEAKSAGKYVPISTVSAPAMISLAPALLATRSACAFSGKIEAQRTLHDRATQDDRRPRARFDRACPRDLSAQRQCTYCHPAFVAS